MGHERKDAEADESSRTSFIFAQVKYGSAYRALKGERPDDASLIIGPSANFLLAEWLLTFDVL